jgi:hypothetical protein
MKKFGWMQRFFDTPGEANAGGGIEIEGLGVVGKVQGEEQEASESGKSENQDAGTNGTDKGTPGTKEGEKQGAEKGGKAPEGQAATGAPGGAEGKRSLLGALARQGAPGGAAAGQAGGAGGQAQLPPHVQAELDGLRGFYKDFKPLAEKLMMTGAAPGAAGQAAATPEEDLLAGLNIQSKYDPETQPGLYVQDFIAQAVKQIGAKVAEAEVRKGLEGFRKNQDEGRAKEQSEAQNLEAKAQAVSSLRRDPLMGPAMEKIQPIMEKFDSRYPELRQMQDHAGWANLLYLASFAALMLTDNSFVEEQMSPHLEALKNSAGTKAGTNAGGGAPGKSVAAMKSAGNKPANETFIEELRGGDGSFERSIFA